MRDAKIFLHHESDNSWTPMVESEYPKEDILQRLLADQPDLLPGDQISPESPVQWLLVAREMSVPDSAEGGGRWSLDHLFLDQQGMPTFVECKRSGNRELRREVVAQMLEYVANGLKFWSVERLRQVAEETAAKKGKSLDDEIRSRLIGPEGDIEDYWQKVKEKLRAGGVRLVFVADTIPQELRCLIEFLNNKMAGAGVEVLAVEIKQYVAGPVKALVPRVIGITEEARQQKRTGVGREPMNERTLLETSPIAYAAYEPLLAMVRQRSIFKLRWTNSGFNLLVDLASGKSVPFFYAYAYADKTSYCQIFFTKLNLSPEEAEAVRNEMVSFDLFKLTPTEYWSLPVPDAENLTQFHSACEAILNRLSELAKAH
jgi:hypothetical protein